MRGINKVLISGNVSGATAFNKTGSGTDACSFKIASDRRGSQGGSVTAWIKVNAYGEPLVAICKERLMKGIYVIVEGELMNRDGERGELTEVRAKEIVFIAAGQVHGASNGGTQGRKDD